MTKAQFCAAVPELAGMSPQAQDQTLAGWINSGRIKAKYAADGETITDIDTVYVAREARRTNNRNAKAAGLTR